MFHGACVEFHGLILEMGCEWRFQLYPVIWQVSVLWIVFLRSCPELPDVPNLSLDAQSKILKNATIHYRWHPLCYVLFFQDRHICSAGDPGNSQHSPPTPHLESIDMFTIFGKYNPSLCAVKELIQQAVHYSHFSVLRNAAVAPYFFELGHCLFRHLYAHQILSEEFLLVIIL